MSNGFDIVLMESAGFKDSFLRVKSLEAALDSESFSDNGLDDGILEASPLISTEDSSSFGKSLKAELLHP
jgi:hypothetical protein